MKAKIISFDEVLERIKSGNVKNIYIIDILSRFVRKVSDVEVDFLTAILKTYRLRKWALW